MKKIIFALLSASALSMPMAAQGRDVPDARVLPVYKPAYPYGAQAELEGADQGQKVDRLEDAIRHAYYTNPTLLAERATLRSTDADYFGVRASYGPRIDATATHGYRRDNSRLGGNWFATEGFSTTASLIFTQPVYTFGRLGAAESSAVARIALGRDSLRLTESQTMLDVITSYVSVLRDREALDIAAENLKLLERQYGDSSERFRVREITSSDLQQIETRLEFGRAQYLNAQAQLGNSRAGFLNDIGTVPGELAPPPPLPLTMTTLEDAYSYAELNSPIVRAAQSREKISRAAIAAARAETMPQVDLSASGTYGSQSPYTNDFNRTEIVAGVNLTVPLIDNGVRRSRIEAAQQANESDWRLIDAALRDTRRAVASAWNNMLAAEKSLVHYEQAVDAARRAYEGASVQEKAGARTTLDVLDLARDLLTVRTNYATARANVFLSRAALLAAVGSLEGPQLVPDINAYDPVANFDRVKRKGDIPLLTDILSSLEALDSVKEDRPIRDPSGALKVDSSVLGMPASSDEAVAAPVIDR